jgi:hypothetical protein
MYVLARILKVENKEKYKTANDVYFAIRSETGDFLFTEKELERAQERAEKNIEDIPIVPTYTQDYIINRKDYYKKLSKEYHDQVSHISHCLSEQSLLKKRINLYKVMIVGLSVVTFLTGLFLGFTGKIAL